MFKQLTGSEDKDVTYTGIQQITSDQESDHDSIAISASFGYQLINRN